MNQPAPDNPAFWEATKERGLVLYQGDSVVRIPPDKLPNLIADAARLLTAHDARDAADGNSGLS